MLHALGPDIWTLDFPYQVGALSLGTRTTVVKTPEGLWVHAPGPLSERNVAEINALGEVRFIVSPNSMHYLYLDQAAATWPGARTYATHALQRKKKTPEATLLSDEIHWPGLETIATGGSVKLGECVFYHAASKTLILTDLAFNVTRSSSSFTRFFMKLNGAYGHFGPSRLFRFLLVDQPKALHDSIQRILRWDFENIVLAHGEVVTQDGHDTFRRAFTYLD